MQILFCKKEKSVKILDRYNERECLTSSKIFEKIECITIEQNLFLKHDLSLSFMAMEIGTNRTYLSKAFRARGFSFRDYVNGLRLKYMLEILRGIRCSGKVFDGEDLALICGFSSKRSMNESSMRMLGLRYYEIRKRDSAEIEKMSTFVTQKYNYGRRKSNIFNERGGEGNTSQQ